MPRRTDPELLVQLGARMARLRRDRGITQEQLAEAAGLEPLTLSRCENGSRTLSIANMARVAEVLGIGLGDLVDVERTAPTAEQDRGEAAWVRVWRRMTPEQRDAASRMMREFVRTRRGA